MGMPKAGVPSVFQPAAGRRSPDRSSRRPCWSWRGGRASSGRWRRGPELTRRRCRRRRWRRRTPVRAWCRTGKWSGHRPCRPARRDCRTWSSWRWRCTRWSGCCSARSKPPGLLRSPAPRSPRPGRGWRSAVGSPGRCAAGRSCARCRAAEGARHRCRSEFPTRASTSCCCSRRRSRRWPTGWSSRRSCRRTSNCPAGPGCRR